MMATEQSNNSQNELKEMFRLLGLLDAELDKLRARKKDEHYFSIAKEFEKKVSTAVHK